MHQTQCFMKHWEKSWKYDAQRNIFDELRCVSSGGENTESNAWYYFSNKMILEGEIKDAKMSSVSSDFKKLIKHKISFVSSWLMSLRSNYQIYIVLIK